MTDREIPLCKFWDIHNKNILWRGILTFPESIHLYLPTDLERHMHICMNHCAVTVQETDTWETRQGKGVFAGRKGPFSALSPLSKPYLGLSSWDMQQESHLPTPSFPCMRPGSPWWRSLQSLPGMNHAPPHTSSCTLDGRREENRLWSSLAQHTLFTWATYVSTHIARRDPSMQGSWVLSEDQPLMQHAAYPPTSGSIARSQLGREARVHLQRC